MLDRDGQLERILTTHAAALSRVAASYESRPALREELMQEISLALWRALPNFRQEASEKTFVLRIATNRALSHIATRGPAPHDLDAAAEVVDPMPRPEELAARLQGAQRLQHAVHGLPLTLRQVMVLALEGLDPADIARVLGITAGNVAVRLHRGKAMMKAALGEDP